jgi:hypothetical protein
MFGGNYGAALRRATDLVSRTTPVLSTDRNEGVEADETDESPELGADDGTYAWVTEDWRAINDDARKIVKMFANRRQSDRLNRDQIKELAGVPKWGRR